MSDRRENIRWGAEQRLEFIEFRLFWEGGVNRGDLTEQFGVSVPQASADLSLYRELEPDNIAYDATEKKYVPGAAFNPKFYSPNADRYLAQLRAISDGILRRDDVWMEFMPSVDAMPIPQKRVDANVLSNLLRAYREKRAVEITYQSMSRTRPDQTKRRITPHSFFFDGMRWYVRAYCHLSGDFRSFSLSRCYAAENISDSSVSSDDDKQWSTKIIVTLAPNPLLSSTQQKSIAEDYCMTDGRLIFSVREALLIFFNTRLRLDVPLDDSKPNKTPLVVVNRIEYDAVLNRLEVA